MDKVEITPTSTFTLEELAEQEVQVLPDRAVMGGCYCGCFPELSISVSVAVCVAL